jgi:hypothetical protein
MDLSHINLDKKHNVLLQNKLAFLAGVFEGEGSFGLWKGGVGTTKKYFRIQVEMSDQDIIQQFIDFFGIGKLGHRKPRKKSYKDLYSWRINGEPAVQCLYVMFPFLGERRQEKFKGILKILKERHGS